MENRYFIVKKNGICITTLKYDISFEEAEKYLLGIGCKRYQMGEYVWYKNDDERDEYGLQPKYEIRKRKGGN